MYANSGPNHRWHADGNDKLCQFGIYIHGCIDGWSRKMIWLKVGSTNRNPNVVAKYYTKAVREHMLISRTIRVDRGTENGLMLDLQSALRSNFDCDEPPYIYGSSNHNVRIERWWAYLKPRFLQDYINTLHDMQDLGLIDTTDNFNVEILRFCFCPALENELEKLKLHWNQHRVRQMTNTLIPSGIPNFLYDNPEHYYKSEMGLHVDMDELDMLEEEYGIDANEYGCDNLLAELLLNVMVIDSLNIPETLDDAVNLYAHLMDLIF